MKKTIRDLYKEYFPEDEIGHNIKEMTPEAFMEMYNKNPYQTINYVGADDSDVRDNLLMMMSDLHNLDYHKIIKMYFQSVGEYAKSVNPYLKKINASR